MKSFFAVQEDLGMIAVQPIRDSNDNGPGSGIFLMDRHMDAYWIKKMFKVFTQPDDE